MRVAQVWSHAPHVGMFRKGWANGDALAESEVPRDPALPQLATLLDGAAMLEALRRAPATDSVLVGNDFARCRIVNVRYRPGRECLVNYALDAANGGREVRFACAKVMSEAFARRHLSARLGAARDAGVPFAYWPDERTVLTVFPHDLRIRSLHRIVEEDYYEGVLRRVLGDDAARLAAPRPGGPALSVASYRPERSCLLRGLVQCSGAHGDEPQVVFARVYRDERGADIARAMAALWNSAARQAGRLSVPEPLGYDPISRTYLQRQVAGVPLPGRLQGEDAPTFLAAVGRGLAALHSSPIRFAPGRSAADGLDWIAAMGRGLSGVRRDMGERLVDIAGRLRAPAPSLSGGDGCLVHGDFSMNQVLVAPGQVSLIDFDDVATGDAYADLGTFLARMEGYFNDHATRGAAERAFCQDYFAARGGALDEARLNWHRAAGFARLALSAVGQLRPGWPDKVVRCLGRAERILSDSDRPE